MATFDDFDGVFFTIQALRLYHDVADCEFVVIDNNPNSKHGEAVRGYLANSEDGRTPMRYVPFVDSTGTTQTRERIFSEAQGEAVLVMDCHVMLAPNAIHYLKKFYAEADSQMRKNLFTGPLLMDNLSSHQTHFEPEWRDQMWGIWATTWVSPSGSYVVGRENNGQLEMKTLNTDGPWQAMDLPWPSHEKALMERGYRLAGWGGDTQMFEIPAQGLGLFSSLKEHWLGFNPNFRSFGGEECYIHEKYRQAGRTTFCLPFLKWNHRFGRPGGPKYPITVEGKMRNYILGFQELGLDLEPVRKHFVDEVGVSPDVWQYALLDPVNYTPGQAYGERPENSVPSLPVATSNLGLPLPALAETVAEVSEYLQTAAKRDLDEHAPTLIALASRCNNVVEITGRRESTAFLLHGTGSLSACEKKNCSGGECTGACKTARRFHSFQAEQDTLSGMLQDLAQDYVGVDRPVDFSVTNIGPQDYPDLPFDPDLLFLDLRHGAASVKQELEKYAPRVGRYIIFHDTVIHGQHGDDGGPGMLFAIREYLKDHPEWFVVWHNHAQYGLTVLGKLPEDRPEAPIRPWPSMDKEGKLCGCGQSLKASLKLIGIEASENCSCNARAAQMDVWGPDLCRENIETILDWLKEQADARSMGHLFVRPVVKLMVLRAIKAAEKQIKSGNCY